MKILSICNEKGGVAKTTSALQIATLLADEGRSTLLIDMDPQGHCSLGLGQQPQGDQNTTFEVLTGACKLLPALVKVDKFLQLLPATNSLSKAVTQLQGQPGADQVLREILESVQGYDFIVIDCPPSMGILTINALSASHFVVVPLIPQFFPLAGTSEVKKTIHLVQKRTNPQLEILGALPTLVENTNIMMEVMDSLQTNFGARVFSPIPKATIYADSQALGVPLQRNPKYSKKRSKLLKGYWEVVNALIHKTLEEI